MVLQLYLSVWFLHAICTPQQVVSHSSFRGSTDNEIQNVSRVLNNVRRFARVATDQLKVEKHFNDTEEKQGYEVQSKRQGEKRRPQQDKQRKEQEKRHDKKRRRQIEPRKQQQAKKAQEQETERNESQQGLEEKTQREIIEQKDIRKKETEEQRLAMERQRAEVEAKRKEAEEKQRRHQEAERRKIEEEAKRRRQEEKQRKLEEEKKANAEKDRHRLIQEEQDIERWIKFYLSLKQNQKLNDKDFWQVVDDDKTKYYSEDLKIKILAGLSLKPYEEDKFENEFGRYKERHATAAIDIISSINYANDRTDLHEGDILKEAADFDYKSDDFRRNPNHYVCWEVLKDPFRRKVKKSIAEAWEGRKRDARRDRVYLWLDRTVPYEIDSSLRESTDTIKASLKKIEQISCLKFVEKGAKSYKNWLQFIKKIGCWSMVGKMFWKDGPQELSLGDNCVYDGIIIHEVLHALGFWHEQSRPDRDKYVEIFWENIKDGQEHNFQRYDSDVSDILRSPYDFASIMHYGKYSFANDAETPTILSINNPNIDYGQRNAMSTIDIQQLNSLYDCKNKDTSGWSDWTDYGPCDKDCKKESTRFCKNTDRTSCPEPSSQNYVFWGLDSRTENCIRAECDAPVDGHWGRWGPWSTCDGSCGVATRVRSRDCDDPSPKRNGKSCKGDKKSVKKCLLRSCSAGEYDCSFEEDDDPLCSWKNDPSNSIDWARNSGPTASSGTGPSEDKTTGLGYYLYMEASSPARQDMKVRLLSKDMPAGSKCMKLAYNMYGQGIGTLKVYVKNKVTSSEKELFSRYGDQLQQWNEISLDITAQNTHQVVIEAIRGNNHQGDIAIDDIIVKDGSCSPVKPIIPRKRIPTVFRVGCFHSKGYINGKRLFPKLKNLKTDQYLKWHNVEVLTNSTKEIVQLCSAFAKDNGYEYFGIEYYGECWTGPTSSVNYARDGEAEDCWPKKSDGRGPFIVGKDYSVMVYKWIFV